MRRNRPEHPAYRRVVELGASDRARGPTLPDWVHQFADVDRRAADEPAGPEAAPTLLTIREKAVELRCSERKVRRLIKRGELPYIKVGRSYLLPAYTPRRRIYPYS